MHKRGLQRLLAGKTGVFSGRTELDRIANLARAILDQAFKDLTGKSAKWRADAERLFDPDHTAHLAWLCEAARIDPVYLWRYYHRTKAGLLATRSAAPRSGAGPDRVRAS